MSADHRDPLPERPFVLDAHAHGVHLLPRAINALHRATTRGQPEQVDFEALATTPVDAAVVAAVGDPLDASLAAV